MGAILYMLSALGILSDIQNLITAIVVIVLLIMVFRRS